MRTKSLVLICVAALALSGCKKKGGAGAGSASGSGAGGGSAAAGGAGGSAAAAGTGGGSAAAGGGAAAGGSKLKALPEIAAAIKAVAKASATDPKCKYPPSCPLYADAKKAIGVKGKDEAVLESMAALVTDDDPAVRDVTGFLFYLAYAPRRVMKSGKVKPEIADALMAGLSKLKKYAAVRTAPYAVYAATITDKLPAIEKAINAHEHPAVAPRAIAALMTYGRLKAFPLVQKYAKSEKPELAAAAFKAPREMYKWTDDERKAICPWAMAALGHKELRVATEAAHVMNSCKHDNKYIEALIAEGKKRVAAGEWKAPYDFPFRDVCFGGFFGTDKKAPTELCDKNYKFLLSITNNKKVPANMRARALDWIVYQRRDRKSYNLLKKYKSHKVKEIATVAKKGMEMLERSYLKKK